MFDVDDDDADADDEANELLAVDIFRTGMCQETPAVVSTFHFPILVTRLHDDDLLFLLPSSILSESSSFLLFRSLSPSSMSAT